MIARYDCELDAGNEDMSPSVSMTQSETGDYVLHEDHVKAVASLSTALRDLERDFAMIESYLPPAIRDRLYSRERARAVLAEVHS